MLEAQRGSLSTRFSVFLSFDPVILNFSNFLFLIFWEKVEISISEDDGRSVSMLSALNKSLTHPKMLSNGIVWRSLWFRYTKIWSYIFLLEIKFEHMFSCFSRCWSWSVPESLAQCLRQAGWTVCWVSSETVGTLFIKTLCTQPWLLCPAFAAKWSPRTLLWRPVWSLCLASSNTKTTR